MIKIPSIFAKILYIFLSFIFVYSSYSSTAFAQLPITENDLEYIKKEQYYRDPIPFPLIAACGPLQDLALGNKTFFIGDSLTLGFAGGGEGLKQASEAGFEVDTNYRTLDSGVSGGEDARFSGRSIEAVGGFNIDRMIPKLLEHPDDFSEGNADIIVIALGTNDYGRNRYAQMVELIDLVRSFNQSAQIYWVNTYFQHPEVASYQNINADISKASIEKEFTVIDYATAAAANSEMAPPTRGNDQIHLSWDAYKVKAAFILSQITGAPSVAQSAVINQANSQIDVTSLTEDQKIAQTFIIGVSAAQANELPNIVGKYRVGGVFILGSGQQNDVFNSSFFESLNQIAGIPLIVASDEEGGNVQRFASQIGSFPSAKQLGSLSNEEVEITGRDLGSKLKELGVNTALAPVADLALPGSAAVTELDRGFSDNPNVVAEKVDAFARGLQSSGVTPTYKHFPGLGSTANNTDFDVGESPDINSLRNNDLRVYEGIVNNNNPFIMLNNAIVPGITVDGEVFGTSQAGVNLLRNEYGFEGIVTTDALNAEGVKNVVGNLDVSVAKSLQAGVTMPLFAYTNESELQDIIDSVKSQGIDVSSSLNKVLEHKEGLPESDIGCESNKVPGDGNAEQAWNFFVDKIGPIQTAAAMGNFQQESRLEPDIVNSIGATGIAQWLGGRKDVLFSRPEPLSLQTQLQFVYDEFLGQNGASKNFIPQDEEPSGTYEEWLEITDLAVATVFFRRSYERPGEAEALDEKRIQYATEFLTQFGSL